MRERRTLLEDLSVYYIDAGALTPQEVAETVETTVNSWAEETKISFIERWRDEGRLEGWVGDSRFITVEK